MLLFIVYFIVILFFPFFHYLSQWYTFLASSIYIAMMRITTVMMILKYDYEDVFLPAKRVLIICFFLHMLQMCLNYLNILCS